MPIQYGGIVSPGYRNRGGGGGVQFVDNLPIASPGEYTNEPTADARDNVIYILKTNIDEGWWRSRETVAAVAGSFTDENFDTPRTGYSYEGAADSDPDTDDLAVYYNRANDQWRRKDAGSLQHSLTSTEFSGGAGGTWLEELTDDPDTTDAAIYFNTNTRRFRQKLSGPVSSSLSTVAFALSTVSYTYAGAHASDPTADTSVGEIYYNTNSNSFRFHNSGSSTWSGVATSTAIGNRTLVTAEHTESSLQTWLDGRTSWDSDGYVYYDVGESDLRTATYTPASPWFNADFEDAHDENNAGWLGDHGLPGSEGVDTVVEAVDFLNDNSYDPTTIGNLYIGFYNTDSGKVERITGFTLAVEWEDTTLMFAFNDGVVHWMGLQSTSSNVVDYLDANYESGPAFIYDDGTNIKVILTFTATVPEYERPVMDRIPFSGDTTGVSQAIFDLLSDRVDELEDDVIGSDEDFPDASEDHQDTIKIVDRKAYTVEGYQTANVDADGDWRDYSHSHFQGAFADDPGGLLIQNNYYYNTAEHVWKRVGLERSTPVYLNIHDPLVAFGFYFVGEFSNEQAASDAVRNYSSSNEYLAYFDGKINRLHSFTAAQSPQDAWRWVRIGADEAKRIAALEQQVSLHWSLGQPRTVITGNDSQQLEFDVTGLQRFLQVDDAYGLLNLTVKFTPSDTFNGNAVVTLQHGTTDIDSETRAFTDDTEQTVELSGEISDASNGIFITVSVTSSSDTSESVAFEDIDLEIVAGVDRTVVVTGDYDSMVFYSMGQIAFSGTRAYMSRIDDNINNDPVSSPTQWWRLDTPAIMTVAELQNPNSTVGRLVSASRLVAAINAHETYPWDVIFAPRFYRADPNDLSVSEGGFTFEEESGDVFLKAFAGDHDTLHLESLLEHGEAVVLEPTHHDEVVRMEFLADWDDSENRIQIEVQSNYASLLTDGNRYELGFTQGRPDIGYTELELETKIREDVEGFAIDGLSESMPLARYGNMPVQWFHDIELYARDYADTESDANFAVHTQSGQRYIHFQSVAGTFITGLEVFTLIGLYRAGETTRRYFLMITGDLHATYGYPVERIGDFVDPEVDRNYDVYFSVAP